MMNSFLGKKILILIGVLSGCFIVLSMAYDLILITYSKAPLWQFSFNELQLVLLGIFTASFSLIYLQSGAKDALESYDQDDWQKVLKNAKARNSELSEKVESYKVILNRYEADKGLGAEEKSAIINDAVKNISESSIQTIFDDKANKFKDELREKLGFDRIAESSNQIIQRLRREIADLRLRSNINLIIGMIITAVGLYLLWSTVTLVDSSEVLKQLASEGQESNNKFLKSLILPLIPKILLVIFIEVFAYFFLRLYKNGLSEIKYFQNELTNIESKLAAVEFSYITNNQDSLKTSIETLSKTERNYILEKGQTTVELERAKSDSELTRNIVKTIPELFKRDKK